MTQNMPPRGKSELITNIPARMRDGVTLYGDLYKPAGEGRRPAILCRYIFRKENMARSWELYNPYYYTQRGYAVFIQDVRGLGQSEGEFTRFTADGRDGYDTIEWMAEQSWCDGNVGMFGHFYSGFLQYAAALEHPPHLRAICPIQTGVTLNRNNDARGFLFASHIGWCLSRVLDRMDDGRYDDQTVARLRPRIEAFFADYQNQARYRPLREMPAAQFKEFPILGEYIRHIVDGYDDLDLIHEEGKDMDLGGIEVPVLEFAGWMDSAHNSAIDQHLALSRSGAGEARRSELVVGPWTSGEAMAARDVELDFGNDFSGARIGISDRIAKWFDRWLKREEQRDEDPAPIAYFVMGKNAWRASRQWPPINMRYADCYLRSGGGANSASGDGRLSFVPPELEEPSDSYLYNPNRLIPTLPMGRDGKQIEGREDILVYTSDELEADMEITGLIKAALFVSSSAPDTDFMVKLLDVFPDGRAIALSEGAARARYRNSWEAELLEPGFVYEIGVKAGYISYQFAKGHRVRIEVASSNFMKFDYNHNTGRRPGDDPDIIPAINTVHHRPAAASRILLPVVPSEGARAST
jgi:uncharacterized protein